MNKTILMDQKTVISQSAEETFQYGQELGRSLPSGSIVCFFGDLGAGKTTLIKGLASAATQCDPSDVNSPTFVYLNIYEGPQTVYHFDLYRLEGEKDFLAMGFDEYFSTTGICCLEWSEKIQNILPQRCLSIYLRHIDETKREIKMIPPIQHD